MRSLRRGLTWLHRWVGLVFGLLVFFLAVTGAAIVFRAQMEPAVYRQLMAASTRCTEPVAIDTVANNAQAFHPAARVTYVFLYGTAAPSMVRFGDTDQVYVDACTGRVLGDQVRYGGIFGAIEGLHKLRFAGALAMPVIGTCALILALVLVAGGLLIWWPRRAFAWKPDLRLRGRARAVNLHMSVGIYASAVIFIVAVTAVPLAIANMMKDPAPPALRAGAHGHISLQSGWERARCELPGPYAWASIKIPKPGEPIEYALVERDAPHGEARNYVFVDPRDGAIVAFRPYRSLGVAGKLYYWALAIHTGKAGGPLAQALMLAGMLALVFMVYLGFESYLRKAKMRSFGRVALLCALGMVAAIAPVHSQSTNGLDMQTARDKMQAQRGKAVAYTQKWDLSELPPYVPGRQVHGTLRMWGSDYITFGNLATYWEAAFRKYQPGVTFDWHMDTTLAAVPSLVFGVSDMGIGRKVTFSELELFERYTNHDPVEISIATGSYNVPGWNPGFGIVVNSANPIARITMGQLDGVFGAERSGGWIGTSWHPEFARGPEKNIRTWGQLGLTGAWADKPIHVYGLNLRYHQATEMSDWVLQGSDKWNEQLRIYANYVSKSGSLERGLDEDLSNDPYGIAYIAAPTVNLGTSAAPFKLKMLDLAANDGGPYVAYTIETLHDRSYPLYDQIYAYVNATDSKHLDPKVLEFLRFIVSREGQAAVMRDGKYLPLTAPVAKAQLAKLNALLASGS